MQCGFPICIPKMLRCIKMRLRNAIYYLFCVLALIPIKSCIASHLASPHKQIWPTVGVFNCPLSGNIYKWPNFSEVLPKQRLALLVIKPFIGHLICPHYKIFMLEEKIYIVKNIKFMA